MATPITPTLRRVPRCDTRGAISGRSASASSSHDRDGTPNNVLKDNRRAWVPKSKTSPSDWLEVEFPPTEATKVVVLESDFPGAITKVVVQGQTVWEGPCRNYGRNRWPASSRSRRGSSSRGSASMPSLEGAASRLK